MTSELEAGVRVAIKRLSDDTTVEAAGVKIYPLLDLFAVPQYNCEGASQAERSHGLFLG